MKDFLFKVTGFFVGILALYYTAVFINSIRIEPGNDYMAAIIDKHERVNSIKSPRLIFAGGSNLAFGINSEKIQSETGLPVVNMGLHAGLGLEFILEELKRSVRQGDIVYLSPEYYLDLKGDFKLKRYTGQFFPEANSYYQSNPLKDGMQEIKIHIEKTRNEIKAFRFNNPATDKNAKNEISVYSRKAFNKYGDVVAHLGQAKPEIINDRTALQYRYWEGIKVLNEFNDFAKANKVKVFFVYPNYPQSEYEKNKKAIKGLAADLAKDLTIEIINRPEDFLYDDTLFFDTIYHLSKEGREKRTEAMLRLMKL